MKDKCCELHNRAAFYAMAATRLRAFAIFEPTHMRRAYERIIGANVSFARIASGDASFLEETHGSVFPGVSP